MRASNLSFVLACTGILLSGCGGATTTDLFSSPQTDAGLSSSSSGSSSGTTGSSSGSGSGGSSGSSSGSGSGSGSGGSSGSSSGSGSGSGSSSGSSSGSGSGSGSSSGGGVDAGNDSGSAGTAGITCGTQGQKTRECKLGSQVCCAVQGTSGGSSTTFKCTNPSAAGCVGDEVVAIPCDDSAQCPSGELCCGTNDDAGNYGSVSCQLSCSSGDQHVFCDPNADPDICASLNGGETCSPSEILPGYYVCANASGGGGLGGGTKG